MLLQQETCKDSPKETAAVENGVQEELGNIETPTEEVTRDNFSVADTPKESEDIKAAQTDTEKVDQNPLPEIDCESQGTGGKRHDQVVKEESTVWKERDAETAAFTLEDKSEEDLVSLAQQFIKVNIFLVSGMGIYRPICLVSEIKYFTY